MVEGQRTVVARGWHVDGLSAREQGERQRRVRRVLFWILWANLALVGVKVGVGWVMGSLAVLGDAAHSSIDALNNVIGLTAIRFAAAPPDEDHPYGHGKFETLGALAIAGFLSVTCFELLKAAIESLAGGGSPPRPDRLTVAILGSTIFINVGIAYYERRRGRELGSELLDADSRHTLADVWVTVSVLLGLGLVSLGWEQADAILAALVAFVVAYSGLQILRRTVPVLVDRRAVDPQRVYDVAISVGGVESVTEIRSRGRPGEGFAELTVKVNPATPVRGAHRIADEVERRVAQELDLLNVVVHVEPSEIH